MNESFLNNHFLILTCLILSAIRVYLEIIKFDFEKLPLTKKIKNKKIHKVGFYLSLGNLFLFLPTYIF